MARFLGIEGFVVVEASNGQEALTHLRTGCGAAAILLDLRMPVMDGWAFRHAQRADRSIAQIPVIVISGADAHRFHELDAVAAFEKPVKMSGVGYVRPDSLKLEHLRSPPPTSSSGGIRATRRSQQSPRGLAVVA